MFDLNPILSFVLVIFGVIILFSLIRAYFNRDRVLVYTAFGNHDYFAIVAKLKAAGVKYQTETPIQLDRRDQAFYNNTQYDIYVKKKDEHLAASAIHK